MRYDFDEVIDRKGTNAMKTDMCPEVFGREDVMPMWVADMDFRTPDFIIDAIKHRLEHPVLGYSMVPQAFYCDWCEWIKLTHGWDVKSEWLGFMPGIVPGLAFAVNAFTHPGDEVIVQPPVYPPFLNVPRNNGRTVVCNPLKEVDGKFEMDFDDLVSRITPKSRLFILCNPHNPGGRTWSVETLRKLAEICAAHHILVVSDEIHADMALPGHKHVPFATVSDVAAQNSVTYMAPSKTFNMAGLISSLYIIPNAGLKARFATFLESSELANANFLSIEATRAAFQYGGEWRKQMLEYVQGNVDFVNTFVAEHGLKIRVMQPEASFLLWLDFTAYGLCTTGVQDLMVNTAKVGMNLGTNFGSGGECHLRLNIGCSRETLAKALERIKSALESVGCAG